MDISGISIQAPPSSDSPEARFRSEMGQISRHSAVFFLGTLFTAAAGYLFKIYVARMLGSELLGTYALGMTMVSLLTTLAALGFPDAAGRFVPAYLSTGRLDPLRGFLGRGLFAVLLMSLLLGWIAVAGAHWVSARLYHTPALESYMPLFGVLIVTTTLNVFGSQVLAGFKDIARRTVITTFIGTPLVMILAVLLMMRGAGLKGYIAAQVISAVAILFLLARAVWQLAPPAVRSFSPHLAHLEPEAIHFSAVLFGVNCVQFLMGTTDKMLLGFFLNAREVGIYAVAAGLVAFVPIILQTVNQILTPVIAGLHARGERDLIGRLYRTLTKWILGLTIPLILVMLVFAPALMRLFGRDFEAGWPVLMIGVVGQLVNCGVGSVGQLLLMSGNQSRLIRIQVVMAMIAVGLNAALIPWLGIVGAAIAGATVNVWNNVWCLIVVRRVLGISPYDRSYFALVLPSAASALCVVLLHRAAGALPEVPSLLLGLCLGYLAFIAAALLFGLNEDDRLIVRAIWYKVEQFLGVNT